MPNILRIVLTYHFEYTATSLSIVSGGNFDEVIKMQNAILLIKFHPDRFHASGKFFFPSGIKNFVELRFKTFSREKTPRNSENQENNWLLQKLVALLNLEYLVIS